MPDPTDDRAAAPDRGDHYAALGVDDTAPHVAIRDAHRRIMRESHPDVAGGDRSAAERATRANAAWSVLKDPARRAAYDRQRAAVRAGAGPAARPAGPGEVPTPSWGPGGIRPVTADQLREAAARSQAYSEIGRAQRAAFSAASRRVGWTILASGAAVLALVAAR